MSISISQQHGLISKEVWNYKRIYFIFVIFQSHSTRQRYWKSVVKKNWRMRSAIFWNFTQGRILESHQSFGKSTGPIFKPQVVQRDCLTLKYGTGRLSSNVGKKVPIDGAQNIKRSQISLIRLAETASVV